MVLTLIGLAAVLLAFFSSSYRKPALVTAGGIFVGGHLWYFVIPVDEIKYWVFDKYCESASETVFSHQSADHIAIEYRPWSGVIEDRYYPSKLTQELLQQPSNVTSIQLFYDVPRNKVAEASCSGKYVTTVQAPGNISMPGCGKMTPASAVEPYQIFVSYHYEDENFLSIRPFRLLIKNTKTGKVLAEQRSYQLLLGSMQRIENRRWYGWGSAQGAKVCKLTPPKEFILRVVGSGS